LSEVFVVGSVNRDFVFKVARRPEPGETVTDAELSLHEGGKGANQAAAAALLGASVTMLGRVGDDEHGAALRAALMDKGVDTSPVRRLEGEATGAAFVTLTRDGENSIVVAPGANRALVPGDVDAVAEVIQEAHVLVTQMEVNPQVVERAVQVAASGGVRALVNLAPPARLPQEILGKLDPLVVNEHEASFMLGEKIEGIGGALAAAPELVSSGPCSVVVTLGADGAVLADREQVVHLPAPEVEAADTTGAGDAFVGALAARLAKGDTLVEAASYAVLAGAAAVTVEGAQSSLPTHACVEALRARAGA